MKLIIFLFTLFITPLKAQIIQEWVQRINGPADSTDHGWSVVTDNTGNVFVAGQITNEITKANFCLIKYNPSGVRQWIKIHNGPANGEDNANAVAIDNDGNLIVTGGSTRQGSGLDFCTIKFDSNGNQLWTSYYNSLADSADGAFLILTDSQNNIYVSGFNKGNMSDIVLIKYNSSGEEQWVRVQNGPANGWDRANSMKIDAVNNIYLTGFVTGNGTGQDYCTIKYNSSGDQLWMRTYNGPINNFDMSNSIVLDDSVNVYVNGTSAGSSFSSDFYTIKYNSNGDLKWAARYNHTVSNTDGGSGVAVDKSGNVYSFGESVGSGSDFDWALIKYDPSGNQQWVKRYNGPANGFDDADDVITDNSGNIYCMGASLGANSDLDFFLMKYDGEGNIVWEQRYDGTAHDFDFPASIYLDAFNNVYLTGNSTGISQGFNLSLGIVTIKYSQTTGIVSSNNSIPVNFKLEQNIPNPFNPSTKIQFQVSKSTNVSLKIYDMTGREIENLFTGHLSPGTYQTVWNAHENAGGIYFCTLNSEYYSESKKMILIK